MIAVDTNVLLRYLLQDDPDQCSKANKLFNDLYTFDAAALALAGTKAPR